MRRYKTEYDAQAGEFMRKWGVKIHRRFIGKTRYFPDDREPRNVWKITLKRNDGSSYSFRFGTALSTQQRFRCISRPTTAFWRVYPRIPGLTARMCGT